MHCIFGTFNFSSWNLFKKADGTGIFQEKGSNFFSYLFLKQGDPEIQTLDVGDAIEVSGHGTGGAVADMDGDGQVELLLSHGESASEPLTMYSVTEGNSNNYIRYVLFI